MASELPVSLTFAVQSYYKEHKFFSAPDRFGDRIGMRARFGTREGEWTPGKPGLTIRPDGGEADIYTDRDRGRLEVRIYGPMPEDCDVLYAYMLADVQVFQRTVVSGEWVLQVLTIESAPTYLTDPDTNLPMYLFFMNAAVRTSSTLAEG